jgi:hypothetical protein
MLWVLCYFRDWNIFLRSSTILTHMIVMGHAVEQNHQFGFKPTSQFCRSVTRRQPTPHICNIPAYNTWVWCIHITTDDVALSLVVLYAPRTEKRTNYSTTSERRAYLSWWAFHVTRWIYYQHNCQSYCKKDLQSIQVPQLQQLSTYKLNKCNNYLYLQWW